MCLLVNLRTACVEALLCAPRREERAGCFHTVHPRCLTSGWNQTGSAEHGKAVRGAGPAHTHRAVRSPGRLPQLHVPPSVKCRHSHHRCPWVCGWPLVCSAHVRRDSEKMEDIQTQNWTARHLRRNSWAHRDSEEGRLSSSTWTRGWEPHNSPLPSPERAGRGQGQRHTDVPPGPRATRQQFMLL